MTDKNGSRSSPADWSQWGMCLIPDGGGAISCIVTLSRGACRIRPKLMDEILITEQLTNDSIRTLKNLEGELLAELQTFR